MGSGICRSPQGLVPAFQGGVAVGRRRLDVLLFGRSENQPGLATKTGLRSLPWISKSEGLLYEDSSLFVDNFLTHESFLKKVSESATK